MHMVNATMANKQLQNRIEKLENPPITVQVTDPVEANPPYKLIFNFQKYDRVDLNFDGSGIEFKTKDFIKALGKLMPESKMKYHLKGTK